MQDMEELSELTSQTPADATQRVHIDGTGRTPAKRPPQRSEGSHNGGAKKSRNKRRVNKWLIIVLCAVILALVLTAVVIHLLRREPAVDDGRIHSNVYAAGVNLGGMTPDEAKQALQAATDYTYNQLNMVITILDTEVKLTPGRTGADLDVDALVQAAYDYGRTSESGASNYISVLPYLNLDTEYIKGVMEELGEKYGTTLTQTKVELTGEKPDMNVGIENVDTETVRQILYITVGTPEYGLDTDKLYNQIMDAYESNIFSVQAECSIDPPEALDLSKVYQDYIAKGDCREPVDAVLDEETFKVTNEIYGYGFNVDAAQAKLDAASYGEKIEIGLTFIEPNITAELLAGDLFRDVLAKYTVTCNKDSKVMANLKLVCKALNGKIIKSGEKFSFNTFVGQTSKLKGYAIADSGAYALNDGNYGGGASLVASGIYYCAVLSDMDVTERANHKYASKYINLGLDADVSYGVQDLIFTNTSHRPIKITAKVSSKGVITVTFEGTFNEEYSVKVSSKKTETLNPTTLFQQMMSTSAGGYQDGAVLVEGITGYEVSVYRTYQYKDSAASERKLVAYSSYDKKNTVVVQLIEPEPTIPPTTIPPTTEPPVTTQPPVTTEPPVTTQPPVTTAPPVTTQPPVTTEPPVTTQPPQNQNSPESGGGEAQA